MGDGLDPAAQARRTLLRRALYAVPAVVGTFIVSRTAEAQASCIPIGACNPDRCGPTYGCGPGFPCRPVWGCNPNRGG